MGHRGLLLHRWHQLGGDRARPHRAAAGRARDPARRRPQPRDHRHGGRHARRVGAGPAARRIGHGVQEWMGQMGARTPSPLTTLDEVITIVRRLLRGERVDHDGREFTMSDVKLDQPPASVPPVLAGVRGPKSLALAGRVADGLVLAEGAGPTYVRQAIGQAGAPDPSTSRCSPRSPSMTTRRSPTGSWPRSSPASWARPTPRSTPIRTSTRCASDSTRGASTASPTCPASGGSNSARSARSTTRSPTSRRSTTRAPTTSACSPARRSTSPAKTSTT